MQEENLGISSIAELATLTSQENYAGVMRCRVIAFKGYDPLDHPVQPED